MHIFEIFMLNYSSKNYVNEDTSPIYIVLFFTGKNCFELFTDDHVEKKYGHPLL